MNYQEAQLLNSLAAQLDDLKLRVEQLEKQIVELKESKL